MDDNVLDQLVWLSVNTMDNHVDDVCRSAIEEIQRLRAALTDARSALTDARSELAWLESQEARRER